MVDREKVDEKHEYGKGKIPKWIIGIWVWVLMVLWIILYIIIGLK